MPLPTCASFGDCDFAALSLEQIFKRFLIVDDGNGCPVLKTTSGGGGGGGGDASAANQLIANDLLQTPGPDPGSVAYWAQQIKFLLENGTLSVANTIPTNAQTSEATVSGTDLTTLMAAFQSWKSTNSTKKVIEKIYISEISQISLLITYI